jgi:hypothetical protein
LIRAAPVPATTVRASQGQRRVSIVRTNPSRNQALHISAIESIRKARE